jgi:hypothetical protein
VHNRTTFNGLASSGAVGAKNGVNRVDGRRCATVSAGASWVVRGILVSVVSSNTRQSEWCAGKTAPADSALIDADLVTAELLDSPD